MTTKAVEIIVGKKRMRNGIIMAIMESEQQKDVFQEVLLDLIGIILVTVEFQSILRVTWSSPMMFLT